MRRPLLALCALFALSTTFASAADSSAAINLRTAAVAGFRLGMTPKEVVALAKQRFHSAVELLHTVCARDYAAAIRQRKDKAPARCVAEIRAGSKVDGWRGDSDAPGVNVYFVENFTTRPGTSSVDEIAFSGSRAITQPDVDAFAREALARFGTPSSSLGLGGSFNDSWCNGWTAADEGDHCEYGSNAPENSATGRSFENSVSATLLLPYGVFACDKPTHNPPLFLGAVAERGIVSSIRLMDLGYACSQSYAMKKSFERISTGNTTSF